MSSASIIIACTRCGTKNRVSQEKDVQQAKCGRCGSRLLAASGDNVADHQLTIRCSQCRTKNRLAAEKIAQGAKCGKCGSRLDTEELLSGRAIMISDATFEEKVLRSPLPVLLYSWAPWCTTCQSVAPTIDRFAATARGKVRVAKLNVENNPMLASRYNILSVPYLFIFDNGQLKESLPGAIPEQQLMFKMAAYLQPG
jgi:thioredoxin 2